MEGVEEGKMPVDLPRTPGLAQAALVQAPAFSVHEGAEGEGDSEEDDAARQEEEEGPPLGGREDGGRVADVDPAVDGD